MRRTAFGRCLPQAGPRRVGSVLIRRALKTAGGVQLQAAELLGIHRNTLRKKLSETGAAQDGSS